MKNKVIITASLLLVLLLAVGGTVINADTIFTADGFSYTQLDGNYASVCGWNGGSDTLIIPNMLNDSYVREIAGWSFSGRDDFSCLYLNDADYLKTIGTNAFKNCTQMSGSLNLPAQISSIGSSAFQGCSSLEKLYYNTTADIPNQCFYLCSSLSEVILTDGLSIIGRLAFARCSSLEYVLIPDTVTNIDPTAFDGDSYLVIYCYYDSYAHHFAEDNGFRYVILDPENIPTEPPTEEPTEPEGYLLGDTDDNDDVEVVDATWLQRYISLMNIGVIEDTVMQGDVDGDGDPSIVDATFIMRYCVGIDTPFDIGELVV